MCIRVYVYLHPQVQLLCGGPNADLALGLSFL